MVFCSFFLRADLQLCHAHFFGVRPRVHRAINERPDAFSSACSAAACEDITVPIAAPRLLNHGLLSRLRSKLSLSHFRLFSTGLIIKYYYRKKNSKYDPVNDYIVFVMPFFRFSFLLINGKIGKIDTCLRHSHSKCRNCKT